MDQSKVARIMTQDRLQDRLTQTLDELSGQLRWLRFWRIVAVGCLIAAATICLIRWNNGTWPFDTINILTVAVGAVTGSLVVGFLLARRSHTNPQQLAQHIETACPALNQRLLTALEVVRSNSGSLSYMQRRVVESALAHEKTRSWSSAVLENDSVYAKLAAAISFGFLSIASLYADSGRSTIGQDSLMAIIVEGDQILIKPGDVEIERGTNLVITAQFAEDRIPSTAELVASDEATTTRTPMQRNLADPIFGGYLTGVDEALKYHVEAEGRRSPDFQVSVFEYPKMVRCDAAISPPSYTSLPERTIENTIRITVVEGTALRWNIHVNKPLVSATLTDQLGVVTELIRSNEVDTLWTAGFELNEANRWELKLVDDQDREDPFPPTLVARVQPNRPAELKLTGAGDAVVSPIEEFPVGVEANDDYGLSRVGLAFTVGSSEPKEVELISSTDPQQPTKGKQQLEHLIDLESLNAEPDQLVSYHFWAEDIGPDGKPRRTTGDMFFAEVRPFEQIFRESDSAGGQGQPPPSPEQQQQAQQAEQLAELQKEIVSATWNLIRRVDLAGNVGEMTLDSTALADTEVVKQSQETAISQLSELTENLPPDRSPELVTAVETFMMNAVADFDNAILQSSGVPLDAAMVNARAAYQAMLRLRAREFDVTQQQSQQSQSSSSASRSNMQKQLDQLELKNDQNRYEEQKTATTETPSAAQEAAAILSRLKDLARRQADLNEQLKNAEYELQKAETEKEKEEVERKLERLREQQQELLRDADELTSDLEEKKQDSAVQQAAEKLNETRQNLRAAQQALEEKNPSEALTAGSRAERTLDELQEEFQRESSAKLMEAMKDLSDKSQELKKTQEQISEDLQKLTEPQEGPGLRATENRRDQIVEKMNEQADRFEQLLDQVRETIKDAEESQPLLANQLYETQREAQQSQIAEELTLGADLVRRGFDPSATEASQSAGENIETFDRQLQAAANSILGDPTEALSEARERLDDLERALASERSEPEPDQSAQQDQQGSENQAGQPGSQSNQGGTRQGSRTGGSDQGGGLLDGDWANTMGGEDQPRPITGDGFREWANQLREVEDMLPDSELKSRATAIRDRARELRREITRRSREPQWSEIETMLVEPLRQLRVDVNAELLRRSAERNAVVPMDRDPVPEAFTEAVRKYYEQLGAGR